MKIEKRNLAGKRVLVTGASRGLGALIARAFAEQRAELVLAARDREKLEGVARDCERLGARVTPEAVDLADSRAREALVSRAGRFDVLVNNAGVEATRRLLDQSDDEVRAQLELNLTAPIALIRALLPDMIARHSGAIVNVSSMSGKAATPFNSIYAATKHGLNGLTTSLAAELHGTGVHVGVVCPSYVAEAGMWSDSGLRAPRMLREVAPEKVVRAVFRVRAGEVEVLVTPGPMRPLLALRELIPSIEAPMLRAMGIARVMQARADRDR